MGPVLKSKVSRDNHRDIAPLDLGYALLDCARGFEETTTTFLFYIRGIRRTDDKEVITLYPKIINLTKAINEIDTTISVCSSSKETDDPD